MSDMAIYFIESKYKEIFKLKQMLEKEKIPFIIWNIQISTSMMEAALFQLLRVLVLMEEKWTS